MEQPKSHARDRPPDGVLLACNLAYAGVAVNVLLFLVVAVVFRLPLADIDWGTAFPYLGITAAVAVAAPIVILARYTQRGNRGARIGLTVVGMVYIVTGILPVLLLRSDAVAGVLPFYFLMLFGIPSAIYSLVWVILLWRGPSSSRQHPNSRSTFPS